MDPRTPSPSSRFPSIAATALLVAAACWLLTPLGTMVHVEGFSASIESLALHLSQGSFKPYDMLYGFNLEFYATTRAGAAVALAALHAFTPLSSEAAFRVVMIVGLVLLALSSAMFVTRWTTSRWLLSLGVLLAMPGIAESAFFFNDNLLSAALSTTAMVVLFEWRQDSAPAWRAPVAGLLMGAAIFVRADAILMLPAAALGVLLQRRPRLSLAYAAATFAIAVAAVVVLAPLALGFTFRDTMTSATRAVALWNRGLSLKVHVATVILFEGVPALFLVAVGIVRLAWLRDWRRLSLLAGIPLFYNLVYLGKLWEVRSVLPLTPFLAALACIGVQTVMASTWPWLRVAVVTALVGILLLPPLTVTFSDGPRSYVGRFWLIPSWLDWQAATAQDFDTIDALVASIEGSAVIATTTWNADRYLHLTLQRRGFDASTSPADAGHCGETVESFRRNGVTIHHLRLHVPFVPGPQRYEAARWSRYMAACGHADSGERLVYLSPTDPDRLLVELPFDRTLHWAFGAIPRWRLYTAKAIELGPLRVGPPPALLIPEAGIVDARSDSASLLAGTVRLR